MVNAYPEQIKSGLVKTQAALHEIVSRTLAMEKIRRRVSVTLLFWPSL